ncbi:LysR family transcriptional regulator [Rhodococcus sp. P1Y]|uniref:LysR family transcriptional regulator n=1 Tax=Rhodococcus sp. P1Y TaxID=1302308 RepID=UPI000EB5B95F|nr:LysR family transcriptional regulator [Rhodococcus sp. P1Y]AYJ51531.1 LysR family transcriptional regulator [Rhodococcus sp. P1Y]
MAVEIRELEVFVCLAQELHFGRTSEKMYLSQARVSQLLQSLEKRIGGRLLERTSRRVRLTPLGQEFYTSLVPVLDDLRSVLDDVTDRAKDAAGGRLRLGFQGPPNDIVLDAVRRFEEWNPGCELTLVEIPLSDPFGALRRHEVDVAVVLMPVREADLALGHSFSRQPVMLALSAAHASASQSVMSVENLADIPLYTVESDAPMYWQNAQTPARTPAGIPTRTRSVATMEEAITATRAGRGGMLLCLACTERYDRHSLAFLTVTGIEESVLTLVWTRDHENERIRQFDQALAAADAQLSSSPE